MPLTPEQIATVAALAGVRAIASAGKTTTQEARDALARTDETCTANPENPQTAEQRLYHVLDAYETAHVAAHAALTRSIDGLLDRWVA